MRVLGIVGWSGSGKTTLITALLPLLRERGLRVSTVKHTHHGFDMDRPGKDSFRHRAAGAHEVLVASARRWALLHESEGEEPGLPALLARLDPVDLVLVEGFKTHPFPKLEVHRPTLGKPPIWPTESEVVAVACDHPAPGCDRPVLPLNDAATVAQWVLATTGITRT
ncbi:MAG TPA: molybdopterin-guanine dinucleotide biosynthesis protein B [Acetobacteraceae bacterium]|nr:molybdopterin-guanine dinucleotide biosynthesis protein B [Acetobacteraceae bacterium]